jgi:hypothetical protein
MAVLARIGSGTFTITNITWTMVGVMAVGIVAQVIPTKWFDRAVEVFGETHFLVQGAALASVVLLIQFLSGRGSTSFVYSNF